MMPEYDNRNTFTLFRNSRKREGKMDADFNGSFTDKDGNEYWVNAWSKTPKNGGEKFLSGNMKLKEQKGEAPAPRAMAPALDDDLPF
jgi:hypothetical protein